MRRNTISKSFSLALLAGVLWTPGSGASAQQAAVQARRPPVSELVIRVKDADTKEEIARIGRGGSIEAVVGQRLGLRMTALPGTGGRSARYPSTRFTVSEESRQVRVERTREDVGSIVLRARRPTVSGATVIRYEILDPLDMPERWRTGRIYLRVRLPPAEVAETEDTEDTDESSSEEEEPAGVVFYEHPDFRGRSQRFTVPRMEDLRLSHVGNDTLSSVKVDPGCRLVLYEHQHSGGRSTVLYEDITYLRDTRVGNDTASSFELECSDPRKQRGIALYDGEDFRGVEEVLYRDDPSLRDSEIGDNRVRSLRVDRDCVITLFEQANYRGRSMVIDRDYASLRNTPIGRDTVSSVRVDCDR